MLRLALILAILSSLGSLAISQLKVSPKINQLYSELDDANMAAAQAEQLAQEKEAAFVNVRNELAVVSEDLNVTQTKLREVNEMAAEQRSRADELNRELADTKGRLNTAQSSLARWQALGFTIEDLAQIKKDKDAAEDQVTAYAAEIDILMEQNSKLQSELDLYKFKDFSVPLPAGLKGQVAAINEDWDFVILDIGEAQGVKKYGELLVSRGEKLVGKVRITQVSQDKSIANIVGGSWEVPEETVQVGDTVIH